MNFCRTLSLKQQLMMWGVAAAAISAQVDAGKISLQWGKSTDPAVTGYRVRLSQVSSGSTSVVDVGNTTSFIFNNALDGQKYNIAVVAYNRDGVESDPSSISYLVPFTGPTFSLQIGKFSHGTVTYSPHGTLMPSGDVYAAGTVVNLSAAAVSGFMCTGWTINSVFYPGNPVSVSMNQNTVATPMMVKSSGAVAPADPALATLQIVNAGDTATIWIGGEFGAWILEGTSNFSSWTQVATGLTSDMVTVQNSGGHTFYRVRSAQLTSF